MHLVSGAEAERIHPLQDNDSRVLPEVNPSRVCFSRAFLRIPVSVIHTMTKVTVGGQVIPSLGEVRAGIQGKDLQAGTDTTSFINQDHLPRADTSHSGLDSSTPIINQSRKCSTSQFCGVTFSVEVHSSQMTPAGVKLTKARQHWGLSHT